MKLRTSTDTTPIPTSKPPAPPTHASRAETVTLRGADVRAAAETARTSRASHVEAIANAVREGTYKPDPAKIASAMAEDAELTSQLRSLVAAGE